MDRSLALSQSKINEPEPYTSSMKTDVTNGGGVSDTFPSENRIPLTGPSEPAKSPLLTEDQYDKEFPTWCSMMGVSTQTQEAKGEQATRDRIRQIAESGELNDEQSDAIISVVVEGKTVAEAAALQKRSVPGLYFLLTVAVANIKKSSLFSSCLPQRNLYDPNFVMPKTERHYVSETTRKPRQVRQQRTSNGTKPQPRAKTGDPVVLRRWCRTIGIDVSNEQSNETLGTQISELFVSAQLSAIEMTVINLLVDGNSEMQTVRACGLTRNKMLHYAQDALTKMKVCLNGSKI